jgi:hypothetical protein
VSLSDALFFLSTTRLSYVLTWFLQSYSAVSWTTSEHLTSQQFVSSWKGYREDVSSAKVPTEISYHHEVRWGFGIPPEQKRIAWFKLLLLEPHDMPRQIRNSPRLKDAKRMMKELGKTVVEVVADYLRLLWKYAMEEIARVDGEAVSDGHLLSVMMACPAIWPP